MEPQEQPQQAPATPEQVPQQPGPQTVIRWQQQGNEVAPLTELRAYLHELKEQGVAVGALRFSQQPSGKLEAAFGVDYDPRSPGLARLDGTLRGIERIGGGLRVEEAPGQAQQRRQLLEATGQLAGADQVRNQVGQAFAVSKWDGLSAALADVPARNLSDAERQQQQAGIQRVAQVAEQRGELTSQVIQQARGIFELESASNPVTGFLSNFYAQATGGEVRRNTVEADYEATRQQLRRRLAAELPAAALTPASPPVQQAVAQPAPGAAGQQPAAPGVAATVAAGATAAPSKFREQELPQQLLHGLGLSVDKLRESGQLAALLRGERTEPLPLTVQGAGGQQVTFDGRLQLRRDEQGNLDLGVSLPKKTLEIPQAIGDTALTPEQQQQLKTTGQAGLVVLRGKDGQERPAYVGVDPKLNRLVVLPAKQIQQPLEIAGVKLSPEQRRDLEAGKPVALQNMRDQRQRSFDGTAQINAATARIEVRDQTAKRQLRYQQPAPGQEEKTRKVVQATEAPAPKAEPVKAKQRGPRL